MLGLDVSKATLACTLIDPQSRKVKWERTVPNTAQGVQELLTLCDASHAWVLEPTGRYSTQVAQQAQDAGRRVLLAPPKRAKAFLNSLQDRAKTDRLDSHGLALYALAMPLRPYPVKSAVNEKIDQLLAARRLLSQSITSLRQQQRALPLAADALAAAITALKGQRAQLDRQIAQMISANTELAGAQAVRAVPGIGPITAAAVASCLHVKQFTHPDQFVAYIGLDVRIRDSGQIRGRRTLSHEGHAELRRLLFVCAKATLRSKKSPFKAQYQRELAKGMAPTAALCALARKMAKLCWSMTRHGTTYDPERVYKNVSAKSEPAHSQNGPETP